MDNDNLRNNPRAIGVPASDSESEHDNLQDANDRFEHLANQEPRMGATANNGDAMDIDTDIDAMATGMAGLSVNLGLQKFRLREPPLYDGKPNAMVVENWIDRVNDVLLVYRATDNLSKIIVAKSYLDGDALTWFRHNQQRFFAMSWETLQVEIRTRFYPPQFFQRQLAKFETMRQKSSVEKFNRIYKSTLETVEKKVNYQMEVLVEHYLSRLAPEIQDRARTYRPRDLDDAMLVALQAEATYKVVQNAYAREAQQQFQGKSGQINDATGRTANDSKEASKNDMRKKGICFNCQEKGHIAKYCPLKGNRQ